MKKAPETRTISHEVYFTVFERALERPGCIVCNYLDAMERKVVNGTLYDSIVNGNRGGELARPGAMCSGHLKAAAEIERREWPQGGFAMAQLCKGMLIEAQRSVQRQYSSPCIQQERVACSFCAELFSAEMSFVGALEELVEFKTASRESPLEQLCLPHTLAALELWATEQKQFRLRALACNRMIALDKDLDLCIGEYDQRFETISSARRDAVSRSVIFLSGGEPYR